MDIVRLRQMIPASFKYTYDSEEGQFTESTNLRLKRMQFNETASKEFRQAIEKFDEDGQPLCTVLANRIDWWDTLYAGEPFEPTAENIGSMPPDYVLQLAEAVFNALTPNPQKAENSPDVSAQTEAMTATKGS